MASILGAARYRASAAVLILLAYVGLAGCSTSHLPNAADGAPAALAQFYNQKLNWFNCKRAFQCARLTVPVNYADPTGRTITLAVVRALATDPVHRIGSLITNPGGPGVSGVRFFENTYPARPGKPSRFGPQLRADFDMVGFDPRGVGSSAPVTCLSDAELDHFISVNPEPKTPEEIAERVAADKAYVAGCQQHSGGLLPYVGTPNAARDMDVLRAALGDQKMYYLGYSYGTYLGAVYAELFPSRVGRFVLDGPLPPDLTNFQLDVHQVAGFQLEVNRFLADCVTHPDCPLGTNPAAAATALSGFFAAAQQHPVPTGSPRTVDGALAQTGVLSGLYDSPTSWPHLRTALAGATTGDGRALLALADQYNERYPNGHYTNSGAANVAINCLDRPDAVHSTADVQAELPAYQQASPTFGINFVWEELLCADWPVPPQTQPHQIHYTGRPPILVIGNTDDPATPYPGAQDLAGQLGSAVPLTYRSDGHTAYGRGSTCINNAVDQYLTAATPPPARTICQRDPAPSH